MRYAIVSEATGTVVNVVEASEGYVAGRGLLAIASDTANIGDTYENGALLESAG